MKSKKRSRNSEDYSDQPKFKRKKINHDNEDNSPDHGNNTNNIKLNQNTHSFSNISVDVLLNRILPYLPPKELISISRVSKEVYRWINDNTELAKRNWRNIEPFIVNKSKQLLENVEIWEDLRWPLRCFIHEDGLFSSLERHIDRSADQHHNYHQLMHLGAFIQQLYRKVEVHQSLSALANAQGSGTPIHPILFKKNQIYRKNHENCELCQQDQENLQRCDLDDQDIEEMPPPYFPSDNDIENGAQDSSSMLRTIQKLSRAPEENEEEYVGAAYEEWWQEEIWGDEDEEFLPKSNIALYSDVKKEMDGFFGGDNNVAIVRLANELSEPMILYFWIGSYGSYVGGFCWFYSFY
eukprot:gb/GECH01008562.1/.p1 GENE.gb/GECH01008562.1/~~gb/GECH01008562.1/.p1  ORF type:complete len:352 (+),score=88.58 gb/GECH01008562.1/:1-1056(+)